MGISRGVAVPTDPRLDKSRVSTDESIFDEALRRATPDARAAYLDTECAGQPELRREIEALLIAHEQAAGFLASAPVALMAADGTAPHAPHAVDRVGSVVGPYKLLQQIGEGG